jgi:aryl-alcohol dehydrogenase-like predicted oxidoreductase
MAQAPLRLALRRAKVHPTRPTAYNKGAMHYRKLGRTNIEVSALGYGAWGIGGKQWLGSGDQEAMTALHTALENGINFFDTALAYGDGHSEKLIGRLKQESEVKFHIATKVPPMNQRWPARAGISIDQVFPRDYIVKCTELSLKNLGVETIDLQQLHVWNPEWLDNDEWRRGFEDIKTSGKVGAVGVSINDHQPDSALDLIKTGLIDTVQVIYNIFDQSPEMHLFPLCREKNIGVIARVPFDEGSLAGVVDESTQFSEGDFRNLYFSGNRKKEVHDHVVAICEDLGVPMEHIAQIALRFCISAPEVSSVIPGMRGAGRVAENAASVGQGPLPPNTLEVLREHAWARNFYAA